jgi:predicted acetyltransferase
LELKVISETNYKESMELSSYAFQYSISDSDIQTVKERLRNHHVVGMWDHEQLAAKLHIIPLSVVINKEQWKMGGIAGVATFPEYRRMGLVKQLIAYSLQAMRRNDQIVSLLHPFDIFFYRKYGWEVFTDFKKVKLEKHHLKIIQPIKGKVIRMSSENHQFDVETVYHSYCQGFNGMLFRDQNVWKSKVKNDNQVAIYYGDQGDPLGYILYKVRDRLMEVQEFVCLLHEARTQLWNFICQHDSMVDSVNMLMSTHENFPYFLNEPNLKIEISPYFMARIVDAEKCLEKFKFNYNEGSVFIHLDDNYASWNNVTFMIGPTGVKVYKAKDGSFCQHNPKRGLSMNINTLSAILFGYKRPLELYEMDYIVGKKEEVLLLENKIPNTKGFFYDFF